MNNPRSAGLKALCIMAAAAMLVGGFQNPAVAQEQIKLKFAHLFPESQYHWTEGGKIFADEVTKRSNGRVTFEVYPAAQLGKDQASLLQSGLADMAILIPSYDPAKFSRSGVTDLPGMYSSSCEGARKVWALARGGGALDKDEYKPLGLHMLFVGSNPPNVLVTARKQVSRIDDIAGLKLRSLGGGAMDKAIRAVGAVPVKMGAGEVYDSVSRGTVDGAAFTYIGMPAYDLKDVLHYGVDGAYFGSGSFLYAISQKSWDALPDDIKKIMDDAGDVAREHLCKWQDDNDRLARDSFIEKNSFKITPLSSEDIATWKKRMAGVNKSWAAEMDAAGRNGTALLKAFQEAKGQ